MYHFKNKWALRTTIELYLLFLNDVDVSLVKTELSYNKII